MAGEKPGPRSEEEEQELIEACLPNGVLKITDDLVRQAAIRAVDKYFNKKNLEKDKQPQEETEE